MIKFIPLEVTNKVLRQINNCIHNIISEELSYWELIDNNDAAQNYLPIFFPNHLCRNEPQKCINALHDLLEWSSDHYLHDLPCIHEYALFRIFNSFFDKKEQFAEIREKGQRNPYKFHIKNIENYEPDEISILKSLNDRSFYEEDLFWDWDFLYIDEIVTLYQTNREVFNSMGINLRYYLDLMPPDIRKDIEYDLDHSTEIADISESFVIKQITNVIKQMEMDPIRLDKYNENEISDDIKNRLQFALEMQNIIIEREARGGYAKKEIGEIDFFIYKNEDHNYIQLALGENKVWGNFENQIKQLLGYANKNINFGFTITINRYNTYQEIKDLQEKCLKNFEYNDNFKTQNIETTENFIISNHFIPEENKVFRIYHFILNANGQSRKDIAYSAREDSKNLNTIKNNSLDIKKIKKNILERINSNANFEDMIYILENLRKIVYQEQVPEIISEFNKIGNIKRKNAKLIINNTLYNNIQIFDVQDTPVMGFCEKLKSSCVEIAIDLTLSQYKWLEYDNEYSTAKQCIETALKIAQEKYKILDLLSDIKIDIFISSKGKQEFKSYLYKDNFKERFEIFIYTDKDAVYTLLYQLGSILNTILRNEDEPIPKDFIKINKKVKIDLLKRSIEERFIIFSDIFAVTTLANTELEKFAEFTLNPKVNCILEDYFRTAIQKKLDSK